MGQIGIGFEGRNRVLVWGLTGQFEEGFKRRLKEKGQKVGIRKKKRERDRRDKREKKRGEMKGYLPRSYGQLPDWAAVLCMSKQSHV